MGITRTSIHQPHLTDLSVTTIFLEPLSPATGRGGVAAWSPQIPHSHAGTWPWNNSHKLPTQWSKAINNYQTASDEPCAPILEPLACRATLISTTPLPCFPYSSSTMTFWYLVYSDKEVNMRCPGCMSDMLTTWPICTVWASVCWGEENEARFRFSKEEFE